MLTKSLIIRMLLKFSRHIIIPVFIFISFISCKKENDEVFVHPNVEVEESSKNFIVRSSNHLAFPDLIKYQDKWYLTYREGDGHIYKNYSKIIVMSSDDFVNWNRIQEFEIENWDLRDPKFSYNELKNELYLHVYGREIGADPINSRSYFSKYNIDNGKFLDLEIIKMPLNIPNKLWLSDWLWKPIWYKSKFYVNGYLFNGIRTYSSNDLESSLSLIFKTWNQGWSESASIIFNDTIITIVRTNTLVQLGKSSVDNFKYSWKELNISDLGGPSIVKFRDTEFIVAGRQKGRFEIFIYNTENESMTSLFKSNMDSPDIGYNGLYLDEDKLYIVYYEELPNRSYVINKLILNLARYGI